MQVEHTEDNVVYLDLWKLQHIGKVGFPPRIKSRIELKHQRDKQAALEARRKHNAGVLSSMGVRKTQRLPPPPTTPSNT